MTQSDEGGDFNLPTGEALQRYARAGLPRAPRNIKRYFLVHRNNVLHYNFSVESDSSPTATPGTLDLEV
jgi:hypothetical protein